MSNILNIGFIVISQRMFILMSDKMKLMLPINIMNILRDNYGEMNKEELIKEANCNYKEYVVETIKDLIDAGVWLMKMT